MTDNIIGHGARYLFYGAIDSAGYLIGNTTTAPTAGNQDGSRMNRIAGLRSLPSQAGEAEVFQPDGDDGVLTSFIYNANSLPSGQIGVGVRNQAFTALCGNTKKRTIGGMTFTTRQADATPPDLVILAMRQAQDFPTPTQKWEGVLMMCQMTDLGSDFAQRANVEYAFSYNAKKTNILPWGESVDGTNWGTSTAPLFDFQSTHPVVLYRFTGDNSETTFNFDLDIQGVEAVFVNGTLQTLTTQYTVDTTAGSGSITFEAGHIPGSAAKIVALVQVAESDMPRVN